MPHPALYVSERLAGILTNLLALVMQQILVLGAFTMPVHARIARARQRLTRLLANLAAGRLPRQRAHRPGQKGGPKPALDIPRSQAWLVGRIGYRAAGYRQQIDYLLHEPETRALLAAAPPEALKSLGRLLRPLCRLLAVELPAELRLSPRPRARGLGREADREGGLSPPRQLNPKPLKPDLPPLLPLHPQRRPRPLPFLDFAKKSRPA